MIAAAGIKITKAQNSKLKDINLENIAFGKYFTDHMLEADYEDGEWKNGNKTIPAINARAFHFGPALWPGYF